jgi:polyphosphate kinase 2
MSVHPEGTIMAKKKAEGGKGGAAKTRRGKKSSPAQTLSKDDYEDQLYRLQVELVKLQRHIISNGDRILVIFEGRDAAGKDGTIKRIIEYLSPREVRVVALGVPSDRERGSWYFQRFVAQLPTPAEMVLFNRSWYNRAGVEHVMGFCSGAEYQDFLEAVPRFEHMLVSAGIRLFKYYLDISRKEQKKRLAARRKDPLSQWKISPIDEKATKLWSKYSDARDAMLARTHNPVAEWTVVRADDKREARINVIKDLLARLDYRGKDEKLTVPDPTVLLRYDQAKAKGGLIAP